MKMDETRKVVSFGKVKFANVNEKKGADSKIKISIISLFKKILKIFPFIGNIFSSFIKKINSCISKCSILIHFPIILIPISIIMIILIFFLHYYFYSELYAFNFSKAFKDEFLDLYITNIDDLKSELTSLVVKDTKIDIENQLFFQVYFKELASGGLMNQSKNYFPSFSKNPGSTSLYSNLNNIKNTDSNFEIPDDPDLNTMEGRGYDKFGDYGKIYYYMFPHIWYQSLISNNLINQSFFIAYEVYDAGRYFFFRYPKEINKLEITNNFTPNEYLINPYLEDNNNVQIKLKDGSNFYYQINWFRSIDFYFRVSVNNTKLDFFTNISFAHLNQESDGAINKTLITCAQQYFKQDDREFIFNTIFFWDQKKLKDEDNDYTIFIVKDNFTDLLGDINLTQRFSDNETYLLSISDNTEYALSENDFKFFHLNLHENNNSFYRNGIFFDCLNLDYFYDYSKVYSTGQKNENDLKLYLTLYLYKSLFQNVEYTKVVKNNREEIVIYNFNKSERIKQICEKIDFNSYRNYLSSSGIDCWNERTKKFYDQEKFLYTSLINDTNSIEPIYPYCYCLPLFCLKNYENLDENLNNLEFVDDINLPDKCVIQFWNEESSTSNIENLGNSNINKISDLIDTSSNVINYNYVKFISAELNQIPGYILFVIAQIHSTGEEYIHTFFKLITKIEIMVSVLFVLFIASLLIIIIIYKDMKKYSSIISNFKNKFELYVFHSENEDESYLYNNNMNKDMKTKNDKKEEQIINFNINENNLLDDLFLIFFKAYNIGIKDIEKLYSSKKHKSKNQMKLNMMKQKNELFKLLSSFCLYAPFFKLNLNFDYDMYEYSIIIKKYNNYVGQSENSNNKRIKLTKNLLIELISTECIGDYGLITNFHFGYITNNKNDFKKYSIKYTMFENIKTNKKQKAKKLKSEKDSKNEQSKKLVLKGKNVLLNIFENNFEADDCLNFNKLNNAFNFFLINSYYKYSRQIGLENNVS